MRMRWFGVVLAGALAAGCGSPSAAPGVPDATASAGAARGGPAALVGLWKLSVPAEPAETVIRFGGDGELGLFRPCLTLSGQWRANTDGLVLGDLNSYSVPTEQPECASVKEPDADADLVPEWLARVAAFRADGAQQMLLDASGATVARLMPGASPVSRPDMAAEVTGVPTLDAEAREQLEAVAAPLPAKLTPATTAAMLGRWRPDPMPSEVMADGPFVEFQDGGKWQGSDGCNGEGGRWLAGPDGALLAASGPTTLVGCENVSVGSWLVEAGRAGFDGTTLVLVDPAGKELGRLVE
ncbi:hypothetical protein AB0F81_26120 [Actinoplanes sp. NPDC024001]|uniref:hypothetical protein n=1 Tax=Actinoplanes sp. NPDC024001 TaxID=3154598 RepID=UPI0033CFAA6B